MNDKPINVLLIEDNASDARLLQEALADSTTARCTLTRAVRMSEALQRLATNSFDVVLSDLGLPDSHGLETFQRLHHAAPHLPIIVLTGLDDEEVAVKTVQEGAQDYLVKGRVEGDLLLRAMRYAMERRRVQEQVERYAAELKEKTDQLEADLNVAREFQLAFLPRKYPTFPSGVPLEESALRFHPSYQPSGAVGGDFYEIRKISATEASVFLCDVMGHGVRSALVTAIIRGLFEEQRESASDPGLFLGAMNRGLGDILRQTDTTMFATAFYLTVDIATGKLRFANAGHPSPFHVRRETGTVAMLPVPVGHSGPVLGLFDQSVYPTNEATVSSGDLLVMYTDGIFEVPGRDGEEYGCDRLAAAIQQRLHLPPPRLFDELLKEIQNYSATGQWADDVCLLGIDVARLGPPEAAA